MARRSARKGLYKNFTVMHDQGVKVSVPKSYSKMKAALLILRTMMPG